MKTVIAVLVALFAFSSLSAQTPGYSEDIAPIMFKHCVSCHRDGEIAPFALTNYTETTRHANTIKSRVLSGFMPPWKPQQDYGHFINERRLTDAEKKLIVDWVDGGKPEGDVTKMPAFPKFPSGSQLGTPDLVLRLPLKYTIQGNNLDVYRNFVVPTGLTEDKIVAAIEVRPDNRRVVHHVLMWNDTSGAARKVDAQDAQPGFEDFGGPGISNTAATYPAFAPGAATYYYPPNIGLKMYKNSDLIIQMHYAPSPVEEEDQTSINIFFKHEDDTREVSVGGFGPEQLPGGVNSFVMPANRVTSFRGSIHISSDISMLAVFPHMHKLGSHNKLYAVNPKRDTIPLISVPAWDFNWQGSYNYQKLLKIPAGSTLYYESTYDNTADNPNNPNDPPKQMAWGFKTSEEMYVCYIFYIPYQSGDENISQQTVTDVPTVDGIEHSPIDIKGINPNPSSGVTSLEFRLFNDQRISVDCVDLNGRVVFTESSDKLYESGNHVISLPTEGSATGLYICRVHVDGKIVAVPFSIVR